MKVPEETVGELYAKISADTKNFDTDINGVYEKLDKLEEKDTDLKTETKGLSNAFNNLGAELAVLGGALTTVYSYLLRSSGGLQAITNYAVGLIGAGLDTFLFKILLPIWEELTGEEEKNVEVTGDVREAYDQVAEKLYMAEDGSLKFKDATDGSNETLDDMRKKLEDGKQPADEFGNRVFIIGDAFYNFDGATGKFLESSNKAVSIMDIISDEKGPATIDLLNDISEKYNVATDDIIGYLEEGNKYWLELWSGAEGENPGALYIRGVADAAEDVKNRLIDLLVPLGIDPYTGGKLWVAARNWALGEGVEGPITDETVLEYLKSGGS